MGNKTGMVLDVKFVDNSIIHSLGYVKRKLISHQIFHCWLYLATLKQRIIHFVMHTMQLWQLLYCTMIIY